MNIKLHVFGVTTFRGVSPDVTRLRTASLDGIQTWLEDCTKEVIDGILDGKVGLLAPPCSRQHKLTVHGLYDCLY